MPLRICQIIPTLVQGGAEKQMALLTTGLDPREFERHVVVLTHSGPLEEELRRAGVQVHLIGKRRQADPLALVRLIRKLRELAPQVVHTWLFAANSYGRLAAARAGVPVIIAGERSVDPWKQAWHHWVDRSLLRYTTCLATNSTGVVDFYARHGIPRERFHVIANASLPSQPPLDREELFRRLALPPKKYVVGAIGRLWPQKGYPDLMWSAELLRVLIEDVWLVIVGDGPERQRLQRLRDQYGAEDSVRFVGHRSDARQLLTAFDLLWNGSRYEGQSNTILEAMAAGVPVIASDIAGNRDLVVHGQTGYLFPQGDVGCLARHSCSLLRDTQLRRQMAHEARQRAETCFSLEHMVSAYTRLYRELVEAQQSRACGLVNTN